MFGKKDGKSAKRGKKKPYQRAGGLAGNAGAALNRRQRQIDQAVEDAYGRQTTDSNN